MKRHLTVADPPQPPTPECSIDGCDAPARTRGWCTRHYGRWKRHGDPLGR